MQAKYMLFSLLILTIIALIIELWGVYSSKLIANYATIPQSPETNQNHISNATKDKSQVKKLFRQVPPTADNSSLNNPTSDLHKFMNDKALLQLEWMKNVSNSADFAKLKPKRLLLKGDFQDWYYGNGKIDCPIETRGWISKCAVVENKFFGIIFDDTVMKTFDAVVQRRNGDGNFERIYEETREQSPIKVSIALEPPYANGKATLSKTLLASYWRGSDIPIPYSKWIPFKTQSKMTKKKNYALGKTTLAAILVSNCKPTNARLKYVESLQQEGVTVDVYGACGQLRCSSDMATCLGTLGKKYKFYLAFENSNCRDYITEKFFRNALQNNMVPVVLGAPKKDYLYAAPPNSFIHVEDFKSPAQLAQYLKKLDGNDELYNGYFSWKGTGEIVPHYILCSICAALFMADNKLVTSAWPPGTTLGEVSKCLPRDQWYWDREKN